MFSPHDTIVAIATPPGRGGLGVVRISGARVLEIADRLLDCRRLAPRYATFTKVRSSRDETSRPVDDVVATLFAAPRSYTGEDVLEISAHGSPVVLDAIVRGAIDAGARLARPGEFTFRAFLNGKIDLVQAEAVADLIAAATPLQMRLAFDQLDGSLTTWITELDSELLDLIARLEASLDFPDEGYHFIETKDVGDRLTRVIAKLDAMIAAARHGRIIREGATVVITGRPNVGKSSLFNALVGHGRAIVSAVPGTTRDLITETIAIDGLVIRLVDTAGLRDTREDVEREGVSRSVGARESADVLLVVLDGSESLTPDDHRLLDETATRTRVIVTNKSDRDAAFELEQSIRVAATVADGLPEVKRALVNALTGEEMLRDDAAVSNVRHSTLIDQARRYVAHACAATDAGAPEEFVLADLHAARSCFDEVVGVRAGDDVLRHIFEKFCIGK